MRAPAEERSTGNEAGMQRAEHGSKHCRCAALCLLNRRFEETASQGSYNTIRQAGSPAVREAGSEEERRMSSLERNYEKWRHGLLDVGRRNRMMHYRKTRRTTLEILEPDFETLFSRLAVKEETLVFRKRVDTSQDRKTTMVLGLLDALGESVELSAGDIRSEQGLEDSQKTLRNLRAKARLAQEEQGIHTLYVSFGFLEWHQGSSTEILRSPLVLVPVELETGGVNSPFKMHRAQEEILINPTLEYVLAADYHLQLLPFDLSKTGLKEYLDDLEGQTAAYGWRIVRKADLGLLSFLKIVMYRDLEQNKERVLSHPVIRRLCGEFDALGEQALWQDKDLPSHFDHDALPPGSGHLVVSADASQQDAVMLSKEGRSFVLQGPPGTGKSQTITNIIAEAMADGKTVLFVSEKNAALSVVQRRLEAAGLGEFCLPLHDFRADKRDVVSRLAARLEGGHTGRFDETAPLRDENLERLAKSRENLRSYFLELHKVRQPLGMSLYQAMESLASLQDVPVLMLEEDPSGVDASLLRRRRDALTRYGKDLQQAPGKETDCWKNTMLPMVTYEVRQMVPQTVDALLPGLERAGRLLRSLEIETGLPEGSLTLGMAESLNSLLPEAEAGRRELAKALEERDRLEPEAEKAASVRASLLEEWKEEFLDFKPGEVLSRYLNDYVSFFGRLGSRYRSDSRALRLLRRNPEAPVTDVRIVEDLRRLDGYRKTERACAEAAHKLAHAQNALEAFCGRALEVLRQAGISVPSSAPDGGEGSAAEDTLLEKAGVLAAGAGEALRELSGEETAAALTRAKSWFFPGELAKMTPEALAKRLAACRNTEGLERALLRRDLEEECCQLGLTGFLPLAAAQGVDPGQLERCYARSFLTKWFYNTLAGENLHLLQFFRSYAQEMEIGNFKSEDTKRFGFAREELADQLGKGAVTDPLLMAEAAALLREAGKKRRLMPLRKLFTLIPDLALKLKPCFMMSPLSVAYFLDAGQYHFDLVIFDEASQILPEDAVGAIFRGRQVIIAGDTKQMPPTRFFAAGLESAEEEEDFDAETYFGDSVGDSILDDACASLPSCTLLWHYRSRDESLIAFSNREIYGGKLITFPGCRREKDKGLEYIYVRDGVYEGGGRNCNRKEAEECIRLLEEHIQNHPERSLGIVAFSEKQQTVIEEAVMDFRLRNPGYEFFFAEDAEEPFFVKNLENVQGDERDTIIFSICYAKNAQGRMYMRFGPLGAEGGERRLNVAITRAKYNVKLVGSILPGDIDPSRTSATGVMMLREYIFYAMQNDVSPVEGSSPSADGDDMISMVADVIRQAGYQIRRNVGASAYRVDIAVVDPEDPEAFAAGIECDGENYRAARTVRDRDVIRRDMMRSMGWKLHHVWSVAWMKNPEEEKERLLSFLKEVTARGDV